MAFQKGSRTAVPLNPYGSSDRLKFLESRGRSSRARGAGLNDKTGSSCLGLEEGTALAILLRQALGRQGAVKPPRMLARAVKPTRRPYIANTQPTELLWD